MKVFVKFLGGLEDMGKFIIIINDFDFRHVFYILNLIYQNHPIIILTNITAAGTTCMHAYTHVLLPAH